VTPRLIATRSVHGHWECHAEGHPHAAATGERPSEALARFCRLFGLPEVRYTLAESDPGRVVYVLRDENPFDDPCPDCGGSGRYVGLNTVEDCGRCGGKGRVPW